MANVTVTLTLTAADAARITAATSAAGYPTPKAWIVAQAAQLVTAFEQQQLAASYNTPPVTPT